MIATKKTTRRTTKKIKVIGIQKYIDATTGELKEANVILAQDRDFNFDKIWIMHILDSLEAVGNQKIKVMNELLKLKNKENLIIATHKTIQKNTGVCRQIISTTLAILIEADFIKKIQNGLYQINPNTIFKGNKNNRMSVLIHYNKIDSNEIKTSDNPEQYVQQDEQNELEQARQTIAKMKIELNILKGKTKDNDIEDHSSLFVEPLLL